MTAHRPPTLEDLRGVARGRLQREILRDLVDRDPGAWLLNWDHGERSFDAMELRLRVALCDHSWTFNWDDFLVVMVPFTPMQLRWHIRRWPDIRPADHVLRDVLEPLAGQPLNDEALHAARTLFSQTWMSAEAVVEAALGITTSP